MDDNVAALPKIVDYGTSERKHFDKCVSVVMYKEVVIFSLALLEPDMFAPGGPVEQVLNVAMRISLGDDAARELYDKLGDALRGHGS